MTPLRRFLAAAIFLLDLVVLLTAVPHPAAAYTDPGTGAMLWQALAASFVGLMFYARRIISYFRRPGRAEQVKTSSADQS